MRDILIALTISTFVMALVSFAAMSPNNDAAEKERITWCLDRKGVAKTDRTNRYVGCEFDLAKGL